MEDFGNSKSEQEEGIGGLLEKLLARLPYFDGSGRRRLVGGLIFLVGIVLISWDWLKSSFEIESFNRVTAIPLVSILCIFLVYAFGVVVELMGEIFLSRLVSGVVWAITMPMRIARERRKSRFLWVYVLVTILCIPAVLMWGLLLGFIGITKYSQDVASQLTDEANELLCKMPQRVVYGISRPFSEFGEIASKYLIESFDNDRDQKWAAQTLARSKDVLVIVTVAVLLELTWFVTSIEERLFYRSDFLATAESAPQLRRIGAEQDLQKYLSQDLHEIVGNTHGYVATREAIATYISKRPKEYQDELFLKKYDELTKEYFEARSEEQRVSDAALGGSGRIDRRIKIFTVLQPATIFLYVGYFYIVKSATISVLEQLAIARRRKPKILFSSAV